MQSPKVDKLSRKVQKVPRTATNSRNSAGKIGAAFALLESTTGMPPWDLVDRTRFFRARGVDFLSPPAFSSTEARDAGRQLLRSATSDSVELYPGSQKSRSRAAFRSKLQIAYEEADECVDWLEYLKDGRIQQDAALLQEAREIASILAAAVRTAGKQLPTH